MKTLRIIVAFVAAAALAVLLVPAANAAPLPTTPVACEGAEPGVTECTFEYYGFQSAFGSSTSVGAGALVTVHTLNGKMLPPQSASGQGEIVYTSSSSFDARHIPWGTTLICRVDAGRAVVTEFGCK